MHKSLRYASVVCSWVSGVALLGLLSSPGLGCGEGALLLGLAGLGAVLQLGLLVAVAAVRAWRTELPFLTIVTLALFGVAVLAKTPLPLRGRIFLSEPWLRSEAERLLRHPERVRESGWLGLLSPKEGFAEKGVAYLSFDSHARIGDFGLAYAPSGNPERPGGALSEFQRVYGPWWLYRPADSIDSPSRTAPFGD